MKNGRLLLAPALLWLGAFLIIPLLLVAIVSVMQRDSLGSIVPEFSASNYIRFFEPLYLRIFAESIGLSLLTTVLCLLLGYPVAYFIAQAPPSRQKLYLLLMMIPLWINFMIRAYAWILLLRAQGIVNTVLQALDLIDQPLNMLYTPGTVLLGMVYTQLPFMVLPIYVSLEQVDRRLLEAAADLGASPMRTFRHVTLPLTKAGVAAGCILVFVFSMGLFIVPDILGGSKTAMFSNIIQNQFLSARNWPFGAALSVLLIAFCMVLISLYYRLTGGQSKGGGLM
ncbi:ABC transporter permease [Paenibacillus mesophilus]|uniref:ABC transporter permease n=1 Tax=Paenibacillus mesophilus TaxID=2582849 RepID=UPI00110EC303|nr:ABC transporter permease [Paenibacillus mesophilus]TMV46288.1 ABC transporter permease [Paenibacillus mesophilus]